MPLENATVFSATTENKEVTPPVTNALSPEVSELVGVGKKYATVEDALKSVPHAQNHIKTLEEELQAVKVELEKRRTAEQLLEEIKSGITSTEKPSASPVTPDVVSQLVEQALARKQASEVSAQNVKQVTTILSEKFGEKAEEVYIAVAKENNISVAELNALSKTSPAVVLKLAGVNDSKQQNAGKIVSTVNTETFNKTGDTSQLSSRVKPGASTKEMVASWKIAGQKVNKPS